MALVKCKECGGQVSIVAPTCPHCGQPNPGMPADQPPILASQTVDPKVADSPPVKKKSGWGGKALVKCCECGGQISKKAEKCPHCGAPVKKQTSGCAWLFAIVGVFMIVTYITISSDSSYSGSSSGSTTSAPKISKPTPPSSVTETFIDEEARSLVIRHIEPNKLNVGGREFQTMPNPQGAGVFVFDPRTRFSGVKRNLIWLVVNQQAYPLNSPSKMVTPSLKWPREDGVNAPFTGDVIDYIFEGKPLTPAKTTKPPATSETESFSTKEYRIYRAIMDTPMSIPESEALKNVVKRFGVTTDEAKTIAQKVTHVLSNNGWYGSPKSEVRHASDWKH